MRYRVRMLLLVCVAGCSFDFTDLPRDTPAQLHVLVFADSRSDQLTISAGLQPGRDSDGNIRAVLEDLRHGQVTIEPSQIAANGNRLYEADWSLSSVVAEGGEVSIGAPEVEGAQSSPQQVSIRFFSRDGPDSLFVTGNDPVVLRIKAAPAGEDATVRWNLRLDDGTPGTHLDIDAIGSPPAEITVPRDWFDERSSVYGVQLQVHQSRSGDFVPGRYTWLTNAQSQIYWTVVVEDM